MQTHLGHPDAAEFDPDNQKSQFLDNHVRQIERHTMVKEAAIYIRQRVADETAQAWFDKMDALIGPLPTTADGWNERPELLLRYAQVGNIGLDPRGVARYADYCERQAGVLEPRKYGQKLQVDVDVRVQQLAQRLQEGRARVLPMLDDPTQDQ